MKGENAMDSIKCKCGSTNMAMMKKKDSTQTGLYCKDCGQWQKWVGKKEVNKLLLNGIEMKKL